MLVARVAPGGGRAAAYRSRPSRQRTPSAPLRGRLRLSLTWRPLRLRFGQRSSGRQSLPDARRAAPTNGETWGSDAAVCWMAGPDGGGGKDAQLAEGGSGETWGSDVAVCWMAGPDGGERRGSVLGGRWWRRGCQRAKGGVEGSAGNRGRTAAQRFTEERVFVAAVQQGPGSYGATRNGRLGWRRGPQRLMCRQVCS